MRWTIDIKLTKAAAWENLGIWTVDPMEPWRFLGNLRRTGLYPDYYAAQVRREDDQP